jgi:(1->4)-alpha-D-glucan 1-alpha-D-glucosylmutase
LTSSASNETSGGGNLARYRVPVSTYRLQFHQRFTLRQACELVPYLARLGVTDCYASPLLAARAGSTHGYDIVDHSRLNPEVGADDDFAAFTGALAQNGMGLVLDFVPNHMGVDAAANAWWRDVLENGPSSPYARFFDIDWDPIQPELKGKVLLPILGDQYGVVLEKGQLQLSLEDGTLALRYFDHNLPVNPRQGRLVFEHRIAELEKTLGAEQPHLREFLSILTALRNLPVYTETDEQRITERHREKEVARERLALLLQTAPEIRRHIETNIAVFNGTPGEPASFDRMHDLLEKQAYRLAFWRTAMHEINYRRFFDINELAGLSMEAPAVFDATHRLLLEHIRQGRVSGIRLDHTDGLFDPAQYFERLQHAVRQARGEDDPPPASRRAADLDTQSGAILRGNSFYVIVEKILSGAETLREQWSVDGTTGYDFLNDVNGLFVDSHNAHKMKRLYARFTGRSDLPADELYESKKVVMTTSLASELNVLAYELNRISELNRRSRDFTLDSLRDALREVVAAFPVYRTYVSENGWTDYDVRVIETAVARARRRNPAMEASIFSFVREVLLPRRETARSGAEFERHLRFAMKFQQFTGPVQAKGLEDTTFYRYVPLVSLNDVEGDLYRFGRSPAEFHEANAHRRRRWPFSMLATATHDTKRGEDARARLNVLSELPEDWRKEIARWARLNAGNRATVEGQPAPDRNDEYLFYQTLLGAWPADSLEEASEDLVQRLQQYMTKAIREAKTHTSWVNPVENYEQAVLHFVDRTLRGSGSSRFLSLFVPFQRRIAPLGMVNSLAQLVLKLASPGVPDSYQGNELWDFHLVDPDNRRPVDFARRRRLLEQMQPLVDAALACAGRDPEIAASSQRRSATDSFGSTSSGSALQPEQLRQRAGDMLADWTDGRIKMYLTAVGLGLRRALPSLFLQGEYVSLDASGPRQNHVVAFARRNGGRMVVAVVPRLLAAASTARIPPLESEFWQDTRLTVPAESRPAFLRNVFTGDSVALEADGGLAVAEALRTLPVALLCG